MGEPQVVQHITITGDYYQVVYEQAATKGVLGFKVTAQGACMDIVEAAAEGMLAHALEKAPLPVSPEPKEAVDIKIADAKSVSAGNIPLPSKPTARHVTVGMP